MAINAHGLMQVKSRQSFRGDRLTWIKDAAARRRESHLRI